MAVYMYMYSSFCFWDLHFWLMQTECDINRNIEIERQSAGYVPELYGQDRQETGVMQILSDAILNASWILAQLEDEDESSGPHWRLDYYVSIFLYTGHHDVRFDDSLLRYQS